MPKLKGKNVLVTGGAGFIGSHLVDRVLLEKPGKLVVIDNLFLGKKDNLRKAINNFPALKFYKYDATDFNKIKKILKQESIEVLFNLSVVPLPTSLLRPKWIVDTNVGITTVLCELLRKGYYRTLIHFSSSEVYGSAQYVPMDENHPISPSTPYAASKAACDHIVLSYHHTFGIDTSIIRPFNNYGPRQNSGKFAGIIPIVIRNARQGKPVIIYGDGKQTRDYIYVEDVIDAAVKIYSELACRGKIINIGSGKEISINDLVKKILRILNSNVPIIYKEDRPADVRRHLTGVQLAEKLINFKPKVKLEEGLRETVKWYEKL